MRWKPVGESAATTHPWSQARRTTAGDPDQVQADPTPPAEPPGVAPAPVPPLSPPPLTTARAAATSACRPAVAVRNGAMSGSARTTTTAVLHRGRLYAPDARHQPRRQSPGLEDVMVDLRDEVPRGDVEWDVGEGEDLDLDLDLEEFDISPPRGVRREAAERSRRRRDEDAYMDAVRREHFGSAYVEEPRRSHRDSMEEMDVAAVGVRGRGRWEPRSTSRPAFMVSKAADAAVWEDLKDIKPPMYDGNPLNLDRFLEKLDDWGLTVTEDLLPLMRRSMSSNGSGTACRKCSASYTSWRPRRGESRPSRTPRSGSTSKSGWTLRRWLPSAGSPSSLSMMDGRSAYGNGVTSEGNTPSSAATWRIGTRVTSRLACSPCYRSMDQEGHQGGIQEGQVQPHGQDDAPQGVSYERGELGEEERGPGCQTALPAERSSHHRPRAIARRPRCGALTIVS